MKRRIILLLACMVPCQVAIADGMMYVRLDAWKLQRENQQVALIAHRDGYERMLIAIGLDEEMSGTKAVWIFPIPASPEKARIDILEAFPRFTLGREIVAAYHHAVTDTAMVMAGFSTFPASWFVFGSYFWFAPRASPPPGDVIIHERIVKRGLTSELITTEKPNALARYLAEKGLDLPPDSSSILNWYVGKKYSLVVSYISDLGQFRARPKEETDGGVFLFRRGQRDPWTDEKQERRSLPLALLIDFPTDTMYFPLKPTSVYGSQVIPITVLVVGFATPTVFPAISPGTRVGYFRESWDFGGEKGLESFLRDRMPVQSSKLTRITLSVPSSNLTDDLWLRHGAPAEIRAGSFLAETSVAWGITLYVLFSILAAIWAGMIAFGAKLVPCRRLAAYGLGNLMTMIGFLLLVRHSTIPAPPGAESAPPEAGPAPPGRKKQDPRKTLFVILFYVFFIALTAGSALILSTVL